MYTVLSGPHVSRLPYRPDARRYYQQIRDLPWPVWLDSGFPESGGGRYDIIAADPYLTLVDHGGRLSTGPAGEPPEVTSGNPMAKLRELLGEFATLPGELPFGGGAIGFMGYDLAREFGELPARGGFGDWPDMAAGIYDWAVVLDHVQQRGYFVRQGRDRRDQAWQSALRRLSAASSIEPVSSPVSATPVQTGLSPERYAAAFDRIQAYIRDGDCYQVNFAQRFHARTGNDAWSLYQQMRQANPAPYSALLEYPFGDVLSASPEQFLAFHGGQAQTRPIKGTRARGDTAEQDLALRAQLLSSEKDRAENIMIVDLLRNDLGKVCVPGSVEVPDLFAVESFATVHHLVSTVTGRLRDGLDAIDLIDACFPGGSITGAPKRRAMQIIDELEPVRREVYCGSVFRLGFDGDLDSSITIRTMLKRGSDLYYWAGGGIVADSDCAAEHQESLDKAAAFLRLLDA